MFKQILVKKNGVEIKKLASRKKVLLQTRKEKIEEANNDIMNTHSLSTEQRKELVVKNGETIETIDGSIIFCEVIVEHLLDDQTFELSIREINFLMNNQEIDYK